MRDRTQLTLSTTKNTTIPESSNPKNVGPSRKFMRGQQKAFESAIAVNVSRRLIKKNPKKAREKSQEHEGLA